LQVQNTVWVSKFFSNRNAHLTNLIIASTYDLFFFFSFLNNCVELHSFKRRRKPIHFFIAIKSKKNLICAKKFCSVAPSLNLSSIANISPESEHSLLRIFLCKAYGSWALLHSCSELDLLRAFMYVQWSCTCTSSIYLVSWSIPTLKIFVYWEYTVKVLRRNHMLDHILNMKSIKNAATIHLYYNSKEAVRTWICYKKVRHWF